MFMRALSTVLLLVLSLSLNAGSRSQHRSETIDDDGRTRLLNVIKTDDDYFAEWERYGVRYITRDAAVLEDIENALAPRNEISKAHAKIGRRHAALGREHAALGREHARVAREHARIGTEESEREMERVQRELERKQQVLEERQQELEREQQELERRQERIQRDADAAIDRIFERAVKDGKARRN
jgi:hypothetical protein